METLDTEVGKELAYKYNENLLLDREWNRGPLQFYKLIWAQPVIFPGQYSLPISPKLLQYHVVIVQ